MISTTKAPPTARRAAATAAARLIRSASRPARELVLDKMAVGPQDFDNASSSAGFLFSTVSPSSMISPECMCCGETLTWLELVDGRRRLPLGRGGFYGLCDACTSKDEER
jgi:hypothetical protein